MSKHSSTSHVPAILSAGLLPLMIATRSMPDFSTTLRESDSITPEQVAALDRCRMFESMFGLEKMPRKQLVKHVRDYVEHLKDAHANAGIHTKHQWKQPRRCLKGGPEKNGENLMRKIPTSCCALCANFVKIFDKVSFYS